ncbi:BadF/BadG/BcrA/BcrD ATPase family protein [Nitratireductor basaltis]|uniref:ATPase, BadF/BadG/BcrA/BcrD type n=1 Tax=Nitratireductor basaltis TaxID=472175 RepID=A0A084U8C2_9HYPH|nr:BadF/BadG/BcrA/BcrD ATPase family protein [Nitratireductor basaltis]KFB09208.1 ATPase, BadF/BadG/BcrA/BcrD type [Nitratireductor basaltis]
MTADDTIGTGDLVVAVDGGGTGCRVAIAERSGRILSTANGGPANVFSGFDAAVTNIVETVNAACVAGGISVEQLRQADAVLGLAGANVGDAALRLPKRLPFRESLVLWDAETAIRGGLGGEDGAAAILGTGSVFGAVHGGTARLMGGWGFVLGDQASGAWLGRRLLERVLLAHDGLLEASPLCDVILSRFGNAPEEVVQFATSAGPQAFAGFAPQVLEHAAQDDAIALDLVRGGARFVTASLKKLLPEGASRICLIGGLGAQYAPYLPNEITVMLAAPKGNALDGALAIALERYGAA